MKNKSFLKSNKCGKYPRKSLTNAQLRGKSFVFAQRGGAQFWGSK